MTLLGIYEVLRPLWGLWLMVVFLGICFYAFRPRNKDAMEDHGRIPLRDDDDKER